MQGVANRLAGLHLAYLLQRAGLPVSAAGLQHPDAAPIRKAGVAAGLAQELSLYRKSNSKLVCVWSNHRLHMSGSNPAYPDRETSYMLEQQWCNIVKTWSADRCT